MTSFLADAVSYHCREATWSALGGLAVLSVVLTCGVEASRVAGPVVYHGREAGHSAHTTVASIVATGLGLAFNFALAIPQTSAKAYIALTSRSAIAAIP